MFRFVSDTLLSLVMDKKARNKLKKDQARRKLTARQGKINDLEETVGRVLTPERKALIQNALKVQQAKAKILNDLKDEDKQKLYALALKKLLREGDEAKGE
jgi:Rps23 Pro-64 3,4-dihydroxylase Tpa1-like proline 4-hydroxylase